MALYSPHRQPKPFCTLVPSTNDRSGRFDDFDAKPEAGGETQDGAGVTGDVGLVKRDAWALGHWAMGHF